jgi:hypothetical protein
VTQFDENRQPAGGTFEIACIGVSQTRLSKDAGDDLRAEADVEYLDTDDTLVVASGGRWGDNEVPTTRPLGVRTRDLHEVTLKPDGSVEALEVAIRYVGERKFYAYSDANWEALRTGGGYDLRGTRDPLPNPTKVRVSIRAGVPAAKQDFLLTLADDDWNLQAVPGASRHPA